VPYNDGKADAFARTMAFVVREDMNHSCTGRLKIKKVQAGETCTNFVEQKAEIKVAEGEPVKAAIVYFLNVNFL
jgi:hypothetical protein